MRSAHEVGTVTWFHLLTPAQTTGLLLEGLDVVAGRVLPQDEATFADADAARAAFGHPAPSAEAGQFVDYLLLPDDLPVLDVAVLEVGGGELAPTRVPSGASYWRLEADGSRHLISHFDTPAFGWRNMRGPVWPTSDVGLRARWRDLDVIAAFEDGTDDVHLVARASVDEDPPDGFEWTKTRVSRRTVPAGECELYERVSLVVHDGAPGRVVDVTDGIATLMLERPVEGSRELAPGWHDLRLPESELADVLTRDVLRSA
ncbi:hypothetical protein ACHAAC_03080 [Aeromicrobium sp. CF4.19]|uniref:hypothetical protein n=1 Tax=Aeromicrobium sp. CF4.19 TaxID=3373082 RepID=UPI003EE7B0AF